MFKAFKKITAYTKMANAIDGLNIKLRELKHVLVAGSDPQNLQEEIAGLIYIVRRDIYNPQEEYGWTPIGPIRINSISKSNISLETVEPLVRLSRSEKDMLFSTTMIGFMGYWEGLHQWKNGIRINT